jgi:hypothetical protein
LMCEDESYYECNPIRHSVAKLVAICQWGSSILRKRSDSDPGDLAANMQMPWAPIWA